MPLSKVWNGDTLISSKSFVSQRPSNRGKVWRNLDLKWSVIYPVDKTIIDTALRRSLSIARTGAVAAKKSGKISRNIDPEKCNSGGKVTCVSIWYWSKCMVVLNQLSKRYWIIPSWPTQRYTYSGDFHIGQGSKKVTNLKHFLNCLCTKENFYEIISSPS